MCFACIPHDQVNQIIWQAKNEQRPMTDDEVDAVTQLIEHTKPLIPRRVESVPVGFDPDDYPLD